MKRRILSVVSAVGAMFLVQQAQGSIINFALDGSGISGQGTLTYTLQADGSGVITGITGTLTDTNTGLNNKPSIVNATITGLVPIDPVVPLPENVTAPDFSLFPIANGVPSPPAFEASTSLTYDNVFYPSGSPVVCTDYPFSGGNLDVYGMMFSLSNGDVVGVWSNGIPPGPPNAAIYGVAVADATNTYDYVGSGVTLTTSVVPEPSTAVLMLLGIAGLGMMRRRKAEA